MSVYKEAEKSLKKKYDIDLLNDIVLARKDRAIYYVEHGDEIIFSKIHGKSPLDNITTNECFTFQVIENIFDMDSKYGEVSGKQYYKDLNLNHIKFIDTESNVTIPLILNNERIWLRFHLYGIVKDEQGKTILSSCYITDVTRYLIHEEELYEKTHKDELTRLFNRYALYYHFGLHGHRVPITSFYFDIDDFKMFNDKFGHDIGDKVLQDFSKTLKSLFNDDFICYRLGGDEFYCLLYRSDEKKVQDTYSKIKQSLKMSSIIDSEIELTASVGIATAYDNISEKHVEFMNYCDKLMYESKARGKNIATFGEFKVFKNRE